VSVRLGGRLCHYGTGRQVASSCDLGESRFAVRVFSVINIYHVSVPLSLDGWWVARDVVSDGR